MIFKFLIFHCHFFELTGICIESCRLFKHNPGSWIISHNILNCLVFLISEKFGQEGCDVEEGKKEDRSLATFHFKLQDFISRYKNEDIYMVESLPVKMRGI